MDKSEKLIIIGPSGSGKDFLVRNLVKKGLIPCIKWTTRPMRSGEKEGINYKYVDNTFFEKSIKEGIFITYQSFDINTSNKKWYYGITKESFNSSQIFIMTPKEYESLNLSKNDRKGLFVVYLDIDRKIRESRLHVRDDHNDSINRRLDSDEIDFINFNDYDLKITDPEFSAENVYELMD